MSDSGNDFMTLALRLDHPNPNLRLHIGVQPDRYPVHPEGLDRFVKIDLPLFDVETLSLQLLRDVRRRDRPEQLSFVADARREGELHLLQFFRELLRRAATLVLRGLEAIPL